MQRTFLFESLDYANNHYALQPTIFFSYGILENCAIKQFMRLTCMQLAEVVDSGHWNLACHIAEEYSVIIKLHLLP